MLNSTFWRLAALTATLLLITPRVEAICICPAYPDCQALQQGGASCMCPPAIPCDCSPAADGSVCLMNMVGKPVGFDLWKQWANVPDCCNYEATCSYSCSVFVFDCAAACNIFKSYFVSRCAGVNAGSQNPGRCMDFSAGINGHTAQFELCCPAGQVITGCNLDSSFGSGDCEPLSPPGLCAGVFKCNCSGVGISCGPEGVEPTPTPTPSPTPTIANTPPPPPSTPTPSETPAGRRIFLRE